jgi:hypothetical protein
MAGVIHWFNFEGSTFRYELTVSRHPEVMHYKAKIWRDGVMVGEIQDMVMRHGADVERWTDSAVELLAVIGTERAIRSRSGLTWE